MAISIRKNHLYIVSHFDGRNIGSLWDAFPVNLSYNYNNSAWNNLSTHCKNNQNNIPYVKKICGFKDEDYRTPLSLAFHPGGRLLAMRFVDVKERSLMQEMSVLYDVSTQERPKHYYSCQESEKCFLKYCNERSPDDAIDYIKEISFSEDGRILASPYGNTVRLFAVDTALTPMDCFYDQRFRSYEKTLNCIDFELVAQCSGHSSPVLTCRFNSRYMCLASGCLEGKIVFNCPKI
jgi:WD40 repeat protein